MTNRSDHGPAHNGEPPRSVPEATAGDPSAEEQFYPARLIRLATMTYALLDEARDTKLDRHGRRQLIDMHERSRWALREALPAELANELDDVLPPLPTGTPSSSEIQMLQAQLNGWLTGLLQGLQATAWAQHVASQQQLEELRHARALERERASTQGAGSYL